MNKKLNKIFEKTKILPITEQTKIVIMSDCHRGSGDNYDNFFKNQNIFESALLHYYHNDFIYLELGDGDDMWEVKQYEEIIEEHLESFKVLKKFHDANRLIMFYGNHDLCKKSQKILTKYFYQYRNKETKKEEELLNHLIVSESLILQYKKYNLLLVHGHQVDLLNSTLWRLSRFLVRYVWRPLENAGLKDPTGAAKNYKGSNHTEKKLMKWSKEKNIIVIAGHTHRPIYPKAGKSLYFNDGSCIHPNGITGLEIEKGKITLVKWFYKIKENNIISVGKEIIAGGEPIENFFKQ